MTTVSPKIQIRKHTEKPSRNYSMRNREITGRYFYEGQVFTGDSLEEILVQHPAISGTYHVELFRNDKIGYDYTLGGDVVFEKGRGGSFIYIPHGDIAIVDCAILIEHYMQPLRGKIQPLRGIDWMESVSKIEHVSGLYNLEAAKTNDKVELLRKKSEPEIDR